MPKTLECPICGDTIRRIQNSAKYCSDKCRQQAFRNEKKRKAQLWAELEMLCDKQEKQQ